MCKVFRVKFFCCNPGLPYIFLESTNIMHECDVNGFLVTWDYKTEKQLPDYMSKFAMKFCHNPILAFYNKCTVHIICLLLGPKITFAHGLVKYVSCVPFHLCHNSPATFSQPHTALKIRPSTVVNFCHKPI